MAESEKAIADVGSWTYQGLLVKVGQSHCREKEIARWKLEQELSKAELIKASILGIQSQLDSVDSDWEAKWSTKHQGMVVNVMKRMVETGELSPR